MLNIRIMFHSMPRRWTIYIDDEVILCNLLRLVWAKMPWLRLINVPRGHELKYSLYILKHCRLAKTFRQNERTVRLCALEFQNFPVNAPMSLHEHQPWAPLVCMSALWVPISAPSVYYRTSHQGMWFEGWSYKTPKNGNGWGLYKVNPCHISRGWSYKTPKNENGGGD